MKLLLTLAALLLSACGTSVSERIKQAQSTADEALNMARRTSSALDDGTSSGTTLAQEVEEARQAAEHAQAAADDAIARADDLEARLARICANAPSACY